MKMNYINAPSVDAFVSWQKDVGDMVKPGDVVMTLELEKLCVSVLAENMGITKPVVMTKRLLPHGEEMHFDILSGTPTDCFEYDGVAERRVDAMNEAQHPGDRCQEGCTRAILHIKEGAPRSALKVLDNFSDIAQTRYEWHLLRGIALRLCGDLDGALLALLPFKNDNVAIAYEVATKKPQQATVRSINQIKSIFCHRTLDCMNSFIQFVIPTMIMRTMPRRQKQRPHFFPQKIITLFHSLFFFVNPVSIVSKIGFLWFLFGDCFVA